MDAIIYNGVPAGGIPPPLHHRVNKSFKAFLPAVALWIAASGQSAPTAASSPSASASPTQLTRVDLSTQATGLALRFIEFNQNSSDGLPAFLAGAGVTSDNPAYSLAQSLVDAMIKAPATSALVGTSNLTGAAAAPAATVPSEAPAAPGQPASDAPKMAAVGAIGATGPTGAAGSTGSTGLTGSTGAGGDSTAAAKVDAAAKVPGFSALTSGGLNYSSRAALVKAKLIDGDTDMFVVRHIRSENEKKEDSSTDDDYGNQYLGIQLSIAGAAGSPTVRDYVSSELLMRDNGLVNIYFSPFTQNVNQWANWADEVNKLSKAAGGSEVSSPVGTRATAVDRHYFDMDRTKDAMKDAVTNKIDAGEAQDVLEEAMAYTSWGVGLKAYKPGVESGLTSVEAGGVAYFGIGVDGGIHDFIQNQEGAWDFEVYGAANTANKYILNSLYTTTTPVAYTSHARTDFGTGCAQFTISVGQVNLSLFYAVALDRSTRAFAHDMGGISFTVQQAASPTNTAK